MSYNSDSINGNSWSKNSSSQGNDYGDYQSSQIIKELTKSLKKSSSDKDSPEVAILSWKNGIDNILNRVKEKYPSNFKFDFISNIYNRRADRRTKNLIALNLSDRKTIIKYVKEYILKKNNTSEHVRKNIDNILIYGKIDKDLPEDTVREIDSLLELYKEVSHQINRDRSVMKLMNIKKK
jgi:hypothetical protein